MNCSITQTYAGETIVGCSFTESMKHTITHLDAWWDKLIVMSNLRGECTTQDMFDFEPSYQGGDEPMRGMDDSDWDMWEEWMGWEGAGIRDYTSHINPYI
ncbi:hypothetical protein FEM48_Zijuj01G0316400 [Ziziphus jujuba var. spinosa]|uniref:Uncharacterized protein n=1 Tax=Ziziphus jujuba var. spinosa TaxID=714518 RepID=A0A978W6B4_ZIZJJ|nr:hypothetical protein FEM48_Zijuj01G0316400 [Ziziphus jujuba var. spinosa]